VTWPVVSVLFTGTVQVAQYPPAASFGPRLLSEYEFVWLLDGSAVWTALSPGRDAGAPPDLHASLQPNMLLLAPNGVIDSYHWDDRVPSRHAWAHFRIEDPGRLGPAADWPLTRNMASSPILVGICSYLLDLAASDTSESQMRTQELLGVLLELFVNGPLDGPSPLGTEHIQTAVAAVRGIWQRDRVRIIEVDELAAAAGVSSGHLFRVFRAEYGCGPSRALELVRLARAAVALQRSNASLGEIAGMCGFANPYHFSRRFTAAYGLPPGAFRRRDLAADPLAPLRTAGLLRVGHALGVV
jgi:AraC family transcriptional regulator